MTNITNNAAKEIKKTEDMARGVFYGSFKNIDDKRLEDELEIKISKWKKELKEYIENNNPYETNKIELDIAFKKFKNKKSSNKSYNKNEIINYLNSFKEIDKNIDYSFWIDRLNNENFNIIEKNILSSWEKSYNDKNNIWTLNTIKGKRDKFIVDMESWIKLLKKLKYMSNILRIKTGVLWDFRIGELSEDDISLLKRWIDFINDYKDIEIICENFLSYKDNRCIDNAQKSRTMLIEELQIKSTDTIYILYDASWRRSGKNGFAVTNKGVYVRKAGKSTEIMYWKDFKKCTEITRYLDTITANDQSIAYFTGPKEILLQLEVMLDAIHKCLNNRILG